MALYRQFGVSAHLYLKVRIQRSISTSFALGSGNAERSTECASLRGFHAMPARLIDVTSMGTAGYVRLVITRGRTGEWLSLSHCWEK
jgi:hypothetical protein